MGRRSCSGGEINGTAVGSLKLYRPTPSAALPAIGAEVAAEWLSTMSKVIKAANASASMQTDDAPTWRRTIQRVDEGVFVGGSASERVCIWKRVCEAMSQRRYDQNVKHYIADLKSSFTEHDMFDLKSEINRVNYRAVLSGLKNNVGVNGIRMPMITHYDCKDQYQQLHFLIREYALKNEITVYASPLAVGNSSFYGWSVERYRTWVCNYNRLFFPEIISPFNESNFSVRYMREVTKSLHSQLPISTLLIGPDKQRVGGTIQTLRKDKEIVRLFDIIGSHNADGDSEATAQNWRYLVELAKEHPVWSSENPAWWDRGQVEGLPGLREAVEGGVEGIVCWRAKPALIDGTGRPTRKALEIAHNLICD